MSLPRPGSLLFSISSHFPHKVDEVADRPCSLIRAGDAFVSETFFLSGQEHVLLRPHARFDSRVSHGRFQIILSFPFGRPHAAVLVPFPLGRTSPSFPSSSHSSSVSNAFAWHCQSRIFFLDPRHKASEIPDTPVTELSRAQGL